MDDLCCCGQRLTGEGRTRERVEDEKNTEKNVEKPGSLGGGKKSNFAKHCKMGRRESPEEMTKKKLEWMW